MLPDNIKKYRRAQKMSQEDLADGDSDSNHGSRQK